MLRAICGYVLGVILAYGFASYAGLTEVAPPEPWWVTPCLASGIFGLPALIVVIDARQRRR